MLKSKYLVLTVTAPLLLNTSCKKDPPEACFTFSPEKDVYETALVQFQDCSKNAVRHEWNFGDGSSSTIASPSHEFEGKGTYSIKLTVYSEDNQKDEITKQFILGDWALVDFDIISEEISSGCTVSEVCWFFEPFFGDCINFELPHKIHTSPPGKMGLLYRLVCDGYSVWSVIYSEEFDLSKAAYYENVLFEYSDHIVTARANVRFDIIE